MGLRYSPEELNSIASAFQTKQKQFTLGVQVEKTSESRLAAIGVAHSAIDLANANLQSYGAALEKNIQDMFNLGENFDVFDELKRQSLLNESLGD